MNDVGESGSTAAARATPAHRGRTIAAAILGVLAVLAVSVAAAGVWAKATVLDRGRFTSLASDAIAEPEVQQGLATYITDLVFTAVDVESVVTSVLPGRLSRLAPAIEAGAESAVERALLQALATDAVQDTVNGLVGRAYDRAIDLLRGDGLVDGFSVADGQVRLNTLPLLTRGLAVLQTLGLLSDVELPEVTIQGDPDQQIAALEAALGRDLPDGFGQLVVYQSDTVDQAQASVREAQRALALLERGTVWFVILALVLVAATVLVAPRRWRATLALGAGLAAVMVVLRSVVRQVVADAPGLVTKPGARAAVRSILGGASSGLLRLTGVLLVVALVAVAVGLWRGGWRRGELAVVIALTAALVVVAILDASILSLVLALVVGVGAWLAARSFLPRPAPPVAGA